MAAVNFQEYHVSDVYEVLTRKVLNNIRKYSPQREFRTSPTITQSIRLF